MAAMIAPSRLPMSPDDDDDEGGDDDRMPHVGEGAYERRGESAGDAGEAGADEHRGARRTGRCEMPWSAAASGSWAQARNAQPRRVRRRNIHRPASSTTAAMITYRRCRGMTTLSNPGTFRTCGGGDVAHAYAELGHHRSLQYEQQADGCDQSAQGIVPQGPEQHPFHGDAKRADENQPAATATKNGSPKSEYMRHDRSRHRPCTARRGRS
jgi:hypothetical protein